MLNKGGFPFDFRAIEIEIHAQVVIISILSFELLNEALYPIRVTEFSAIKMGGTL